VAEAEEAALLAEALRNVAALLDGPGGDRVGAVIVEPAQGRGGQVFPPSGFVAGLADLCRERGLLLIADEIFTGFGRTGWRLACDAESVIPDLVCVGKGMSGGMPISACVGSSEAMAAWPESAGEAIHTSTFLGHPASCAAALATLQLIDESDLAARSRVEGARWLEALLEMKLRHPIVREVRGRGLMIGIELRDPKLRVPGRVLVGRATVEAMRRGWILLGAGPEGDVISLSPPLTIERELLELAVAALDGVLGAVEASLA
jgi:4-aminobutyrate aminotransferase-like enzyme